MIRQVSPDFIRWLAAKYIRTEFVAVQTQEELATRLATKLLRGRWIDTPSGHSMLGQYTSDSLCLDKAIAWYRQERPKAENPIR